MQEIIAAQREYAKDSREIIGKPKLTHHSKHAILSQNSTREFIVGKTRRLLRIFDCGPCLFVRLPLFSVIGSPAGVSRRRD
jgi:hypothetical protein